MPDFTTRSVDEEIMDNLECSGEVVHQTLRELEFINQWLGGNHVTLQALNLLKRQKKMSTLHLADLGCGSGDMLRLIHAWALKNNVTVKLTGIDANPHIIAYAKKNLADLPEIELLSLNIFSDDFRARKFDIVIGTLFYHHFSNKQLAQFFLNLRKQVSCGFIINDIHRHPFAYYSIKLLTRWFSKSAMVKYDAPLSVLRAFSKNEIQNIFKDASIQHYILRWRWAFRWQVIAYA
jgi:2-polyprenyl-3-methyl-5-hydroxy-6-metoxy-1,4-benzoquinol methylase